MAEETERTARSERMQDNVVFVGKKPSMAYVLAVVIQLGAGQKEVHIKARGRAISKCVDVAEIVKNKFIHDAKIKDIKTGTVELEVDGRDGGKEKLNVSTMEITMGK